MKKFQLAEDTERNSPGNKMAGMCPNVPSITAAELFGGVRLDATQKSGSGDIPLVSSLCLEHLTVPEVAALRRCGISTVYHDVEAKRLKAYKLGGRLIFSRAEVMAWIRAHATTFSPEAGKGPRS